MKDHHFTTRIKWTGNEGKGTSDYKSYSRSHIISRKEKYNEILGSSAPTFLGDSSKYNPEELFLSSLSACHMLWYLHLCSMHKVIVTDYIDVATGVMEERKDGSGKFREVTLNPTVTIENGESQKKAMKLHIDANKMCFIANSCNFKIEHNAKVNVI